MSSTYVFPDPVAPVISILYGWSTILWQMWIVFLYSCVDCIFRRN